MVGSQPTWTDAIIAFFDGCEAVALRLLLLLVFLFGAYGIIRHEVGRLRRDKGHENPPDANADNKANERIAKLERKIDVLVEYIGNVESNRKPPKGGLYE
jgi:hypothetical protein